MKVEWHLLEKSQAVPLQVRWVSGTVISVFWNETPIKIGKAQEGLNIFNLSGFEPILNDLDFVRGHSEAAQR